MCTGNEAARQNYGRLDGQNYVMPPPIGGGPAIYLGEKLSIPISQTQNKNSQSRSLAGQEKDSFDYGFKEGERFSGIMHGFTSALSLPFKGIGFLANKLLEKYTGDMLGGVIIDG